MKEKHGKKHRMVSPEVSLFGSFGREVRRAVFRKLRASADFGARLDRLGSITKSRPQEFVATPMISMLKPWRFVDHMMIILQDATRKKLLRLFLRPKRRRILKNNVFLCLF